MTTIQVPLDDAVSEALETLCADQQRDKEGMVRELVNRFVATEQARRVLQNPDLISLYDQLADEDEALAEAGMSDYHRLLIEADKA